MFEMIAPLACLLVGAVMILALLKALSRRFGKARKGPRLIGEFTGKKITLQTANDVIAFILDNYDGCTEQEIGEAEHKLMRAEGRFSHSKHLLYALRVTKVVERVTSIKTLASRWYVAQYGPQHLSGFKAAQDHVYFARTRDFILSRVVRRVEDSVALEMAKLEGRRASLKTDKARTNAQTRLAEKLEGWLAEALPQEALQVIRTRVDSLR